VRNRCAITLRCLDALARQTYTSLRVVVVDSHSTDDTVLSVRSAFPEVRVLHATDRDFWAGATNIGVRHALDSGSDWILTINDDALIEADYVERLMQIACRFGCLILGSQINYLEDPRRIWALGTFTDWGTAEMLRLGLHDEHSGDFVNNFDQDEIVQVDALAGNGVLLHHSVFRRIGIYNASMLPHYHADSELVMRAVAAGISAWVTPRVVVLNDFSPNQKRLPLSTFSGLVWSLGSMKSHLYLPALLYIFCRYCPFRLKISTAISLLRRFLAMDR
jgi:GT2 family glycosyltransferase